MIDLDDFADYSGASFAPHEQVSRGAVGGASDKIISANHIGVKTCAPILALFDFVVSAESGNGIHRLRLIGIVITAQRDFDFVHDYQLSVVILRLLKFWET